MLLTGVYQEIDIGEQDVYKRQVLNSIFKTQENYESFIQDIT